MRIVINDHVGHAPQVQLSRALAARGHDVLHLYSSGAQTPKADLRRRSSDAPTLTIEGLNPGYTTGRSFLADRIHEARFGRVVARRVVDFRPNVVVGCNNPLDVQRKIQRACRNRNIPFVYWMQDFYAMQLDRLLANRTAALSIPIGSYYHGLERSLLQRSSAVIAIAHDYLGILAQTWDVHDRQCMVVRNWSPLDAVTPGPKVNAWSRQHDLSDKKVILYTGTLGVMEDPMRLLTVAQNLRAQTDAKLVIVSKGEGSARLAHEAGLRGIGNLRVLPFQPYESYGEMLASADVLLGLVSAEAGVLYVPSKISSYLCAGRPIVLAAPWQNLAAQIVRESGGGRVVSADDPGELSQSILDYLNDADLRQRTGQRARLHAEQAFDIAKITDRFERLFARLHAGPPRRRQRGSASSDADAAA